jgi:predicted metal-dependent peptidase
LAIIDTSGSVDQELLSSFFRQLQYLHRQEVKIKVVEADYRLRLTYIWNGRPPQFASGGGHTDFNPALDYANTSGPYDGVVYFTDGKARIPDVMPAYPLLWLMAGIEEGQDWSAWPGRVVGVTHLAQKL